MKSRKHRRLVPNDAVECFEIQISTYFDADGTPTVVVVVTDIDGTEAHPPIYEVLGVIEFAKLILVEQHDKRAGNK